MKTLMQAAAERRASERPGTLYMISRQVLCAFSSASLAVAPRKKHCATPTAPTLAPVLPLAIFQTLPVVFHKDIAAMRPARMRGYPAPCSASTAGRSICLSGRLWDMSVALAEAM